MTLLVRMRGSTGEDEGDSTCEDEDFTNEEESTSKDEKDSITEDDGDCTSNTCLGHINQSCGWWTHTTQFCERISLEEKKAINDEGHEAAPLTFHGLEAVEDIRSTTKINGEELSLTL
ncbi:hypothetical protein Pyn_36430 [Prunus yedoensis var. nudiflora]|uniref:Uncharacterized protein n=1 Tax=Prunus yedoensis var. nudiflora TaxID=2094558 RepID=A0A314UYW4_PRUYE|nr:hypothetical protein Pyn_36430 [Prunus yedoensis var. nudiflora]